MRAHDRRILRDTGPRARQALRAKHLTPGSRFYGAFTQPGGTLQAKTPGAATVYLTDYTAFHRVMTIKP